MSKTNKIIFQMLVAALAKEETAENPNLKKMDALVREVNKLFS